MHLSCQKKKTVVTIDNLIHHPWCQTISTNLFVCRVRVTAAVLGRFLDNGGGVRKFSEMQQIFTITAGSIFARWKTCIIYSASFAVSIRCFAVGTFTCFVCRCTRFRRVHKFFEMFRILSVTASSVLARGQGCRICLFSWTCHFLSWVPSLQKINERLVYFHENLYVLFTVLQWDRSYAYWNWLSNFCLGFIRLTPCHKSLSYHCIITIGQKKVRNSF